jgi:predicted site-specific integrase-resolvase
MVAETLGLSVKTVMHYIRIGRIKASPVAGNVRKRYVITQEALDEYLGRSSQPAVESRETVQRVAKPGFPMLEKYGY